MSQLCASVLFLVAGADQLITRGPDQTPTQPPPDPLSQTRPSKDHEEKPPHEENEELELLPKSEGLTSDEAKDLLEKWGRNELKEERTPGWLIFVRCLWG